MKKLWIAALIAGVALLATPANARWLPLQPAHTGNWYDPAAQAGEGIMPSVQMTADGPLLFAGIYLRDGDLTRAWFAQGLTAEAWSVTGWWFPIHHHTGAGPIPAGWLRMAARDGGLAYEIHIEDATGVFERSGTLVQLLKPVPGYGWCDDGSGGFGPYPPRIGDEWCVAGAE